MLLANFNGKEHLRHRAVSLRQHGFLVYSTFLNVFLFCPRFLRVLTFFKFFLERFYIYEYNSERQYHCNKQTHGQTVVHATVPDN